MFIKKNKNSNDELFISIFFILSILLSFLFGFLVFRYWQIDVCQSDFVLTDLSEIDTSLYQ